MAATNKRNIGETIWSVLTVLVGVMILVGIYLSIMGAPDAMNLPTETERRVQHVFYFHVASGWVGFFAFLVTAIASILYLITKKRRWDHIALSSVEIGVAFTTANVVSGSIWARPTWNTWWTFDDPRLTLAAIVLMVYIAYLMLRNAIDDPERKARLASIYGIIGFISVPLSFVSVRIWRTIHPAVIGTASDTSQGGFDMSGNMVIVLLFSIFTFSLLYFVLLHYRLRLEDQRVELEEYKMAVLAES